MNSWKCISIVFPVSSRSRTSHTFQPKALTNTAADSQITRKDYHSSLSFSFRLYLFHHSFISSHLYTSPSWKEKRKIKKTPHFTSHVFMLLFLPIQLLSVFPPHHNHRRHFIHRCINFYIILCILCTRPPPSPSLLIVLRNHRSIIIAVFSSSVLCVWCFPRPRRSFELAWWSLFVCGRHHSPKG